MPDAQTLNEVFKAYGVSNPIGSGGGFNMWNIVGGVVFGIIGWCAFIYGKKEKNWRPMTIGIALMVYPYFVPNPIIALIIGIVLTGSLFFWKE